MSIAYHILDEPTGGKAESWIVNPVWPLLGIMLAGAWMGAALFAVNAWCLRGPTWRRETLAAAAMLIGALLLGLTIAAAAARGWLPSAGVSYAMLAIVAWKLALGYLIFFWQQNSYALHEHFGGQVARGRIPLGILAVLGGTFVRPGVINAFDSPFWKLTVD